MKIKCLYVQFLFIVCLIVYPVYAQENINQQTRQVMEKSDVILEKFARKCEKRTKNELMQRKEYWKVQAQAQEQPKNGKWFNHQEKIYLCGNQKL